MTALIIQALIFILALLLFSLFASWIDKFNGKHKEEFIEKAIDKVLDKVSDIFTARSGIAKDCYKTSPWYLVVYTRDADLPMCISNNTIRSIHPDAVHRKLIIKQFNGEDMVIENVEKYVLCAANEMYSHDMF